MEEITNVKYLPKHCEMKLDGQKCDNPPEVIVNFKTDNIKGELIICNKHHKEWQEYLEKHKE